MNKFLLLITKKGLSEVPDFISQNEMYTWWCKRKVSYNILLLSIIICGLFICGFYRPHLINSFILTLLLSYIVFLNLLFFFIPFMFLIICKFFNINKFWKSYRNTLLLFVAISVLFTIFFFVLLVLS